MQLQEEANVFEVNCDLDLTTCSVTGYFTHPKLAPGYNGLVGFLQKTPEKFKTKNSSLLIQTYRNGKPRVPTPNGYFSAMVAAEKIMLGEQSPSLLYFDSITGSRAAEPKLECVPVK